MDIAPLTLQCQGERVSGGGALLTAAGYAHRLALALPEKAEMARPTGVGRALATYEIPIEGRDEWVAAAGLGA